jgi:choline-sulfatase
MRHLFLALALLGCGTPSGDSGDRSASAPAASSSPAASAPASSAKASSSAKAEADAPKPKNVILLTIDSLRADMPWQGYKEDIAPNLTKLANESIIYTRAYSISSYTAKSVGGLLSGNYPSTLYRGQAFFTHYSVANEFFPELLQKAGVRTMGGQAHGYFDRGKNLDQGFDVWKITPGIGWNAETDESITSDKMTPMAIEMLGGENTSGRFFMWIHYMDPHDKYQLHKECPDRGHSARKMYDNEICYTDLWIGKLLEHCKKQPWWNDTVLIVSADHGEAFGEHDMWKHAFALWEVLTHVPLFVHVPGGKPSRVDARRSHIDIAPTIVELTGTPPNDKLAGKSMAREILGLEPPGDREPILLDLPADIYNPMTRATIKGKYKLIEDPNDKYQLYDLEKDPGETHNLVGVAAHKEAFEEMKKLHAAEWAKHPYMAPFGGGKLTGGKKADGPFGPAGWKSADKPP